MDCQAQFTWLRGWAFNSVEAKSSQSRANVISSSVMRRVGNEPLSRAHPKLTISRSALCATSAKAEPVVGSQRCKKAHKPEMPRKLSPAKAWRAPLVSTNCEKNMLPSYPRAQRSPRGRMRAKGQTKRQTISPPHAALEKTDCLACPSGCPLSGATRVFRLKKIKARAYAGKNKKKRASIKGQR